MRAFGCSAKSRKLIGVGSPDELPKTTIVPFASICAIAAASEAPPANSRISAKLPCAFVDAYDDLVGAAQMPAALRAADNGGDTRPGSRGDLGREVPDAAGGAGDQHPLAEQRRAMPQGPQRGQAGDRQRRGVLEADIVRQYRHAVAGTAARCAQPALSVSATTRAPALGPLPSAAAP